MPKKKPRNKNLLSGNVSSSSSSNNSNNSIHIDSINNESSSSLHLDNDSLDNSLNLNTRKTRNRSVTPDINLNKRSTRNRPSTPNILIPIANVDGNQPLDSPRRMTRQTSLPILLPPVPSSKFESIPENIPSTSFRTSTPTKRSRRRSSDGSLSTLELVNVSPISSPRTKRTRKSVDKFSSTDSDTLSIDLQKRLSRARRSRNKSATNKIDSDVSQSIDQPSPVALPMEQDVSTENISANEENISFRNDSNHNGNVSVEINPNPYAELIAKFQRLHAVEIVQPHVILTRMENQGEAPNQLPNETADIINIMPPPPPPQPIQIDEQAANRKQQLQAKYLLDIKEGPTCRCNCCGGLFFKRSIRQVKYSTLTKKNTQEFINKVCYFIKNDEAGPIQFCDSCRKFIQKKQIPPLALANGFTFPEVPDCLKKLTLLEQLLVSPRIPFMRIRRITLNHEYKLLGQCVLIPTDIDTTLTVLPRTERDIQVIQVKLKRHLRHNSSYITETIRPRVVAKALRYLVNTPLYTEAGIQINLDDWILNSPAQEVNFVVAEDDREDLLEPAERFVGLRDYNPMAVFENAEETLINNPGELRNLCIAPGQNQRPLSLLFDTHSEELCFPSLYCGQPRQLLGRKISYTQIVKSEQRMFDRRHARADKLFFSYRKLEVEKINSSISICLRKRKTAGEIMRNDDEIDRLIQVDDGFRFLKHIRNSPSYWEVEKRDLISVVRQFGNPSLFMTVTSSDTRWAPLLVQLAANRNRIISEEQAMELTNAEKMELINSDATHCVRYFDYRFKLLFNYIKSPDGPFSDNRIVHYYYRIEFQHRGAPHAHILLWLENFPRYDRDDESSWDACTAAIDKYITCEQALAGQYAAYQIHHHSFSCRVRTRNSIECRYGIPYLPMDKTRILKPLSDPIQEIGRDRYVYLKEKFSHLRTILSILDYNLCKEYDFNNYILNGVLEITLADYILMIRLFLKKPKIFLKRELCDIHTNPFNPEIIKLHQANMDLQFILDAHACCGYIVDYVNKENRGLSKLLRDVVRALPTDLDLKSKMQKIATKFMNSNEISAQEAAYGCLGLPLSVSSTKVIFINTYREALRVKLLKPPRIIGVMPAESEDIFCNSNIDYYCARPDSLENICLAFFVGWYHYVKNKPGRRQNYENNNDDDDNTNIDNPMGADDDDDAGAVDVDDTAAAAAATDRNSPWINLKRNVGFIKKRTKIAVIKYVRFNLARDPDNYYREQIMLFVPWRNESIELADGLDFRAIYERHIDVIRANRSQIFNIDHDEEINTALIEINNRRNIVRVLPGYNTILDGNFWDENNRFKSYNFVEHNLDDNEIDPNFENLPDNDNDNFVIHFPTIFQIDEAEYRGLLCSLNTKQKLYHDLVLKLISNNKVFKHFVSGGAGVGKSRLIQTLYQSVLRHFNSIPGNDPETIKILLTASTGKAAFNIDGSTLHNSFALPIYYSSAQPLIRLSDGTCNKLYVKYKDLKVVIIDEISMVGASTFYNIHTRLSQIFKTDRLFGNVSIIVVGDFNQLPPVKDRWIFMPNKRDNLGELIGSYLWSEFQFYQLTEIMRQKEDKDFAIALNNLAVGKMTPDDIRLFKSRLFENIDNVPSSAVHLFHSNMEVDAFNISRLESLTSEGVESLCEDSVVGNVPERLQAELLNLAKTSKSSDFKLLQNLCLKVGAKYMISTNLDVNDGLVNGAGGILKFLDFKSYPNNEKVLVRIWLDFNNPRVGRSARAKHKKLAKRLNITADWTPIEKYARCSYVKRSCAYEVQRVQFPVVPAEGITIHKSQGSTYDCVVVHLHPRIKRSGLYVACSRVTSLAGLYLIGNFRPPKPANPSHPVSIELERLRSEKNLEPIDLDSVVCSTPSGSPQSIPSIVPDEPNGFPSTLSDDLMYHLFGPSPSRPGPSHGKHIISCPPRAFKTVPSSHNVNRFSKDPPLPFNKYFSSSFENPPTDAQFKISYLTVQSVNDNLTELLHSNPIIIDTDILILGETSSFVTDNFQIPGFVLIHRVDCPSPNSRFEQSKRYDFGFFVFLNEHRRCNVQLITHLFKISDSKIKDNVRNDSDGSFDSFDSIVLLINDVCVLFSLRSLVKCPNERIAGNFYLNSLTRFLNYYSRRTDPIKKYILISRFNVDLNLDSFVCDYCIGDFNNAMNQFNVESQNFAHLIKQILESVSFKNTFALLNPFENRLTSPTNDFDELNDWVYSNISPASDLLVNTSKINGLTNHLVNIVYKYSPPINL